MRPLDGCLRLYFIERARSLHCAPRHNLSDATTQGAMDSISFDIFLSYYSRDKAAVERIAFLLQQDGFAPRLYAWNLIVGGNWQGRSRR